MKAGRVRRMLTRNLAKLPLTRVSRVCARPCECLAPRACWTLFPKIFTLRSHNRVWVGNQPQLKWKSGSTRTDYGGMFRISFECSSRHFGFPLEYKMRDVLNLRANFETTLELWNVSQSAAASRHLWMFPFHGSNYYKLLFHTDAPVRCRDSFFSGPSEHERQIWPPQLCCGPGDELQMIAVAGCTAFIYLFFIFLALQMFLPSAGKTLIPSKPYHTLIRDTSASPQGRPFGGLPDVLKLNVFIYTSDRIDFCCNHFQSSIPGI